MLFFGTVDLLSIIISKVVNGLTGSDVLGLMAVSKTPGRDTPNNNNNNNNNASTSESRNLRRHTIDGNSREWRPRDWRAAKPRVTRNDTPWATTSEDTEDNWCVVNRRSTARHSMGQCAQCGETNHVTARCRHRDMVQCTPATSTAATQTWGTLTQTKMAHS